MLFSEGYAYLKYWLAGLHSYGVSLGRPYGGDPLPFGLPYRIPFAIR